MGDQHPAPSFIAGNLEMPGRNLTPAHTNGDAETYTIKCLCGFADDNFDGKTVLCERCNTWQHQQCYYSAETIITDSFEHYCVDCSPRPVDRNAAYMRYLLLSQQPAPTGDRRLKRSAPKGHRKTKTKDNLHLGNGYASQDAASSKHRSSSPRDGPPAKRSKITHKQSGTLQSAMKGGRRPSENKKSSVSNATSLAPPTKVSLDQCPSAYFSQEFIRIHEENTDFVPAQANLLHDIGVTNLLSLWLDDEDEFKKVTKGKSQREILMNYPQSIEQLSVPVRKQIHKYPDPAVKFYGVAPKWPYATTPTSINAGELVGEVRGVIGCIEDYKKDPSNNWDKLRHPEHFVYFHPELPIYIDCRSEGTLLRYARRTCHPNMEMVTIITGARDFRFCFRASADIPKDAELTIAWDLKHDDTIIESLANQAQDASKKRLYDFVSTLLAHFGGCGCEMYTLPCAFRNFDRRLVHLMPTPTSESRTSKIARKSKPRKSSPKDNRRHVDSRPSSAGAVSRDHDLDMDESRSTTNSQEQTSSRGGTPGEAGALGLSEREKKKIMHQEKLFEKMENDQQGPKRTKRSSTGKGKTSQPNTPGQVSGQVTPTPAAASVTPTPPAASAAPIRPIAITRPTLPTYVSVGVQTLVVEESPEDRLQLMRYLPFSLHIMENVDRRFSRRLQNISDEDGLHMLASMAIGTENDHHVLALPAAVPSETGTDTEMQDATATDMPEAAATEISHAALSDVPNAAASNLPPVAAKASTADEANVGAAGPIVSMHTHIETDGFLQAAHSPMNPSVPRSNGALYGPAEFHITGPEGSQFMTPTPPIVTYPEFMKSAMWASGPRPVFNQPTPVKKKLSLSEYSRRRQAETPTTGSGPLPPVQQAHSSTLPEVWDGDDE